MGRYDDLLYQLIKNGLRSSFERITSENIKALKETHRGIPEDYLDFLQNIGAGNMGEEYFMLYTGLVHADQIYDKEKAQKLKDIYFLGDCYNKHNIGFSKVTDWELVEVDEKQNITFLNIPFETFIKNKFKEFL